MVPNAPLASDMGKEVHPLTLSMLEMHVGQVKIYREKDMLNIEEVALAGVRAVS